MTWSNQAASDEARRRLDATIALATACHMSDTKWRKLFAALAELAVGDLRWKFIRDERVFVYRVPPAAEVLEQSLGDVLPYPYGPYREIEWIEVPAEQSAGVVEALGTVGKFPVQELDSGVRIVGYSW